MTAATLALAIALLLALAFAVAAGWLALQRARLIAALEHTRADLLEAQAAARADSDRAADLSARLAAASSELADLRARLEVQAAAHQQHIGETHRNYARLLDEQKDSHRRAQADLEKRLSEQQQGFRDAIKTSAQDAFRQASEQLKAAADQSLDKRHVLARSEIEARLQPIDAALKATQAKLGEIELARTSAYAGLTEQIASMSRLNTDLKRETANLSRALSKPQVRGRYGEIQLERVAELSGMRSYCDFDTQESTRDADGRVKRPDMVVRLPNERRVAVDAKTNIEAYLQAVEAENPAEADHHLDRFARHVAEQAAALARKTYWSDATKDAFDFVVMFIPGDQFIDAALQREPKLLDLAAEEGIILASPSTLLGLLRAIHVGWREKSLTDSASALFELGKELHERTEKVLRDAVRVGASIDAAGRAYNDLVGSVDARLIPTLRKFEEAGARSEKTLPELRVIETTVRPIKSLPAPSAHRLGDSATSHAPTGP